MKPLLLLPALIFTLTGYSQHTKDLRFEEVGWTVHIPANTPALDQNQVDSVLRAGSDKINRHLGTELDFSGLHTLFAFLDKHFNSFSAAIAPYDSTHFSSWRSYHDSVRHVATQLIIAMAPRVHLLDSANSEEVIDGVRFQLMYYKTYYPENQVTLETYWFSCLRKGYDVGINVTCTDKTKGREFLNIIRRSSFKR